MSRDPRHSLRLKFALSFALAGLVLVLVHAVAIHQLNRQQEAQLIDQIVSDEMEGLLEQYERQGRLDGPPYRALQRYQVRPDTEALSLRKWFRASWLVQGFVARDDAERAELPAELRGLAARLPRRRAGGRPLSRRSPRDRQHRLRRRLFGVAARGTRISTSRAAPWRSAR
jgi:hypothetical protein